jgi:hypothetical protein
MGIRGKSGLIRKERVKGAQTTATHESHLGLWCRCVSAGQGGERTGEQATTGGPSTRDGRETPSTDRTQVPQNWGFQQNGEASESYRRPLMNVVGIASTVMSSHCQV